LHPLSDTIIIDCSFQAINLLLYGILLFSGSLYLLVLLDKPQLGAVTPIGGIYLSLSAPQLNLLKYYIAGTLLLLGWLRLVLACL
jgi:uncharacterized membrane protein YgdD (TMEM256/DUF423 family)